MCQPLDKIRGKSADYILSEFYRDGSFPLEIGKLLSNIGISNKEMDFSTLEQITGKGVRGLVLSNEKNAVIFYRKGDPITRQRFTIAHELAHCCLHNDQNNFKHIEFETENKDKCEQDAGIFSGELLVPLNKLEEAYRELDYISSPTLALKFGVSISFMEAWLNYWGISYFDKRGEVVLNG